MRARLFVVFLVGGCVSTTFHSQTGTTLPPVADRAVVVGDADAALITSRGRPIGTIGTSGGDLDDQAAVVAATSGGTHVKVSQQGETTNTTVTPASETRSCMRTEDGHTCTTTYVPESTSTSVTPWATYDVFRVEPARWNELPDALRPEGFDPAHHTPSVVDGLGTTLGYFTMPYPGATSGTSGTVFPTAYETGTSQAQGVWLGTSSVRGSTVLAVDLKVGGGSLAGTAMNVHDHTAAVSYTLDYVAAALGLRVGKRVTWNAFALEAGVGIEGALYLGEPSVDPGAPIDASFVEPPGISADLALPVWASLTYKASCGMGVQGLAEYDVRPIDTGASAPAFGVGVIWQPASACL